MTRCDEQPEFIDDWKLDDSGSWVTADSSSHYLWVSGDDVCLTDSDSLIRVPRDVLTRFVERMNHVDPSTKNDLKLGAAVRSVLNKHYKLSVVDIENMGHKHAFSLDWFSSDLFFKIAGALRTMGSK